MEIATRRIPFLCRLGLHPYWTVSSGDTIHRAGREAVMICYRACRRCGLSDGKRFEVPVTEATVIRHEGRIDVRQEVRPEHPKQ